MKTVLAPVAEVDVTSVVDENLLPFAPVGGALPNIKPSVVCLHLDVLLLLLLCIAVMTVYAVLQYYDVRSSYPPDLTGRALSVYTMAMFLGAGLMQTFTGWVADWAQNQGWEPYRAVMAAIALLLASGSAAFRFLPASPLLRRHGPQDYGSTKN